MALIAVLEPTVRSIWPALNTNTPATDIIEIIAVCLKMFKRFCVLAKPLSLKCNCEEYKYNCQNDIHHIFAHLYFFIISSGLHVAVPPLS